MSRPCKLFNRPGGCKYGNSCRFSHDVATSRPSPQPLSNRETPLGICRFYWTQGNCKHEFNCKFRHQAGPGVIESSPSPSPARSSARSSAKDNGIAPFLTEKGLAKLSGSGTDGFFPSNSTTRTPAETHNGLKRFLQNDYRFSLTTDVYSFLTLLSSASTTNTSWSQEDGQVLLDSIASGNGILRLCDIIRWPSVTINAGFIRTTLSFQRGYVPLLKFFSSDVVVKSTLSHRVNAIYSILLEDFDDFATKLTRCMEEIMTRHSFRDSQLHTQDTVLGSQVFASLATVLFELMTRFKNASATALQLIPMIYHLKEWSETWIDDVSAPHSKFDDPFQSAPVGAREHILNHLRKKIDRLLSIAEREQGRIARAQTRHPFTSSSLSNDGIIAALALTFEGPGDLRSEGRRHDNDFADINEIQTAPTHEELISAVSPYLPANLHGAPHHHPAESMSRLLDIQFRLLREELTAPIRTSVQLVRDDILSGVPKTRLGPLLEKCGGKYRGIVDGQDAVLFNVYTGVTFSPLVPDRRGLSVGLTFDTPPGRARHAEAKSRVKFWESMSSKRLMQGGLVALVWQRQHDVEIHMGVLSGSAKELTESVRRSDKRISSRVTFFNPAVELHILNALRHQLDDCGLKILVEAPVMFESIRPFLEALRVVPETIPFSQYLVHRPLHYLESVVISPPQYATVPGFRYQLKSLFLPEAEVQDLKMDVLDPVSVASARMALRDSRLDESQADAVVDALTRELALIQGPPGTGKSFTGVELLRVLIANEQRPILMIAFTNHALDHLLSSVLDANITNKIVRLGSRSADERISQFSIESLEMTAGQSRLDRTFARDHRELKLIEEQISKLMKSFSRREVSPQQLLDHLEVQYPEHFLHVTNPPEWVLALHASEDAQSGWSRVGRRGHQETEDDSLYSFWKDARDLDFLTLPLEILQVPDTNNPSHNRFGILSNAPDVDNVGPEQQLGEKDHEEDEEDGDDEEEEESEAWQNPSAWDSITILSDNSKTSSRHQPPPSPLERPVTPVEPTVGPTIQSVQLSDIQNPHDFFAYYGHQGIPSVPDLNRPLDLMLAEGVMWSFSREERERLHSFWEDQARHQLHSDQLDEFENLRRKHTEALKIFNEGKDETRRQLLKNVDIVGCTTTGAAKLTSLLRGLSPRIMLVEEAGQVLEAHVLGSLVPSVEHLILIGDPLQLRPTLNNYNLSMDSRRGRELYRFDMSLMERISSGGLPMSQINVQRRMRPSISNLIRKTLYPRLLDHELVTTYPNVRGFTKNIFFLSHNHREGGNEEESVSKYNTYEVDMIKDLVLYLLRQGCYSQEGDIVVLCAYLGQLAKLRDALASEVAVVIDDRDGQELADREAENVDDDSIVERVKVSRRVRLRTVDNYQGEEAKIVILSLVRNAGSEDDLHGGSRGAIGFLKSDNRANVALSRAKEGLFILGNASQMASKSKMWREVIDELEKEDCVGPGLPVSCHQHPEAVEYIHRPGILPRIAPDGGCLKPCNSRLKCGHVCPYKCHPDDPKHQGVTCTQPCTRLCKRQHPCHKSCSNECGKCMFPIANVQLPCGHIHPQVSCHQLDDLEEVLCIATVTKALINCEHQAEMRCSEDPAQHQCNAMCAENMPCCGRTCKSRCYQCRGLNEGTQRTQHRQHPCEKPLYCAHLCGKPCSVDHTCTQSCREPCRQECSHSRCKGYCFTPCSPCQKPCDWNCAHHKCPVPCGSVCIRLPCDRRCKKNLTCGHQCPSVCGEDCLIQSCPVCAPQEEKETVVDLILGQTLGDISSQAQSLDELIITLPKCRHSFTVETLDGHCGMSDFYLRDDSGKWRGLTSPQTTRTRPPSCPTCRAPITSPRYGRIFKSADLDILERNVISRSTQSLRRVQEAIATIEKEAIATRLTKEAEGLTSPDEAPPTKLRKMLNKARVQLLREQADTPTTASVLDPENSNLYAIPADAAAKWRVATVKLKQAYVDAAKVAETRSAHCHAWEAAFVAIYEGEMDLASADPSRAPRNPREYAMRLARMKVGQSQPRADKRFVVEAFWITLQIRFTIADLVFAFMQGLQKDSRAQLQMWGTFGYFLLETCEKDAEKAYKIAEESESRRQMTRTALLIMRTHLERFRLTVEMSRYGGLLQQQRSNLVERAANETMKAQQYLALVSRDHRAKLKEDRDWIAENFTLAASTIVDEWTKMEASLRADTFYEPVSLDEKTAIVKAMNFSHTGHWYTCRNGHAFVITECGGATERATCPECNAPIGGQNHSLDASNRRAEDLEAIGREQGAAHSPWAWGR